MKLGRCSMFTGLAAVGALLLAGTGCEKQLTQDDVNDAQQEVLEEERETAEVRNEEMQEVQEQEQEAAAARQEALKPAIYEDAY